MVYCWFRTFVTVEYCCDPERRLASTVRDLSSHVTVLEMNLRWSAMERFWGADNGAVRNVWRTTLRGVRLGVELSLALNAVTRWSGCGVTGEQAGAYRNIRAGA